VTGLREWWAPAGLTASITVLIIAGITMATGGGTDAVLGSRDNGITNDQDAVSASGQPAGAGSR
jgi:hypothetical protein